MIDWIHADCTNWGHQMRAVYLGQDGWPSRTTLGKLIEEGVVGASAGKMMRFFPESLNVEALRVNRVIKTMAEDDRITLFVHYVVVGKGKVKAHRMGLPLRTYYDRLDQAHKRYSGASHALHKNDGIRAVREAA